MTSDASSSKGVVKPAASDEWVVEVDERVGDAFADLRAEGSGRAS